MPSNFLRTGLLLAALTGIFVAMGAAVGGQTGLLFAFAFALLMNVLTYWKSDKMVLRITGAKEVDATTAPEFYSLVGQLCNRASLPMPRVYIVPHAQPNAFATGRNPQNAAVCATSGLLDMLSREEVAGVIAHELAHVKNRDTLTMTIAASFGGAISMFANYLQLSMIFGNRNSRIGMVRTLIATIAAPFAAMLVQMAISRSREYQADRIGAAICGNPLWLASALEKIQKAVRGGNGMPKAEQVPALAHMFICSPFTAKGLYSIFSTHPATETRVAELHKLAAEMGATATAMSGNGSLLPRSFASAPMPTPVASGPAEGATSQG